MATVLIDPWDVIAIAGALGLPSDGTFFPRKKMMAALRNKKRLPLLLGLHPKLDEFIGHRMRGDRASFTFVNVEKSFKAVSLPGLRPETVICSICGTGAKNRSEMCSHLIKLFDWVQA